MRLHLKYENRPKLIKSRRLTQTIAKVISWKKYDANEVNGYDAPKDPYKKWRKIRFVSFFKRNIEEKKMYWKSHMELNMHIKKTHTSTTGYRVFRMLITFSFPSISFLCACDGVWICRRFKHKWFSSFWKEKMQNTTHTHAHRYRNAPTLRIGHDEKVNRTLKINGKEEYTKVIRR